MGTQMNAAPTEPDDGIDVLYLEDDPELAELYELKLQLDGYRVRSVPLDSSPRAAVSEPPPQLLFVDMRSRAQHALEAVAAWRAAGRFHDIPAVMLSALSEGELRERGLRLGELDQVVVMREAASAD
jgi:DNA-binding response OmpR family regulator